MYWWGIQTLILPNSSWTFADGYEGTDQFNPFKDGLLSLINPSDIDYKDFDGFWNVTGQFESVGNLALSDYLNDTYANLITYYQWNNFGQPWFEDYAAQNDGRQPFVDPSPLIRWQYARDNVTEAELNASLSKKQVFKDFIDQDVLVFENSTCSNAIYVEPFTLGATAYRVSKGTSFQDSKEQCWSRRTPINQPLKYLLDGGIPLNSRAYLRWSSLSVKYLTNRQSQTILNTFRSPSPCARQVDVITCYGI